ncbi:kinase-like protein [Mytilinidion resinicola]|uniref:Kinase-like protein n=1 Tax=Mytilinidion resinicola TaxID=574789 RepID=A0A6A6YKY5_9PEZI|nr:kinase-like protein [Mytilinidion resinicola]KAF2808635.1 kinase-like protein [Mytilinidion resinicola]
MVEQSPPPPEHIYRWARQAAEALSFAHSCGVLHADIHCSNFLLDSNLDLKVADFAGASIDGSRSWSCYRYSHRLFEPGDDDCNKGKGMKITVQSEIFALGSAMYAMIQGHDPFVELEHANDWAEVRRRIQKREMPDTSCLPILAEVIRKCWNLEYATMREVLDAIEADRKEQIGRRIEDVLEAIESHRTPTQYGYRYQRKCGTTPSSCSSETLSSGSSVERFHL